MESPKPDAAPASPPEPLRVEPPPSQLSLEEQVDRMLGKLVLPSMPLGYDEDIQVPKVQSNIPKAMDLEDWIVPPGLLTGSCISIRYGLIWKIFDPLTPDLLEKLRKPIVHEHIEEEILFTRPLYDDNMLLTSSVDIFKVKGCQDILLRMTDLDLTEQLMPIDMELEQENTTLEVSVLNEDGQAIIYGKRARSYACAGKRVYELFPFISEQELELNKSKLLTSDGSILVQLALLLKNTNVFEGTEAGPTQPNPLVDKDKETENANNQPSNTDSQGKMTRIKAFSKFSMESFKVRVKSFVGSQEYSDALINILEDKNNNSTILASIPVHRVIISAHSPVLASKLTQGSTIGLQGFSISTVKHVLGYMYDGEFGSTGYDFMEICDIIRFGEKFEVVGLKDYCVDKIFGITDELSVTDGIQIFKLGINWKSVPLKNLAVGVFERHLAQLRSSEEFKSFVDECPVPSVFRAFVHKTKLRTSPNF